jgi:hypothetical protein
LTKICAKAIASRSSAEKRCSVGTFSKDGNAIPHGAAINLWAAGILLVARAVFHSANGNIAPLLSSTVLKQFAVPDI